MILEKLKCRTTRSSTAMNNHAIWRTFNDFLIKLDKKPKTWEQRVTLYSAYFVEQGVQLSTIQSYFSAIKKILVCDNYKFNQDEVTFGILSKSCCLMNDTICTRLPIKLSLLELMLFEMERHFKSQFFLESLYKALFSLAYYGLFRIGELTNSQHVVKVCNVHLGQNKNKILIVLYSSKTHNKASDPQKVKISEIQNAQPQDLKLHRGKTRIFCPFAIMRHYINLRGD